MRGIILQGSSNSDGETSQMVQYIHVQTNFPIVDLKTKHILAFDYEFKNKDDDFLPLIKEIVDHYELIIFATPVYWYSMSGIMKTFFDRISDCLKTEKETGRKLRKMNMAVLSCGYDIELDGAFFMPFRASAKYLGMKYLGEVHTWLQEQKEIPLICQQNMDNFINKLLIKP